MFKFCDSARAYLIIVSCSRILKIKLDSLLKDQPKLKYIFQGADRALSRFVIRIIYKESNSAKSGLSRFVRVGFCWHIS